MTFRIQYLDGAANVIEERSADAPNVEAAIALVDGVLWLPRAVRLRIIDADGREVFERIKGEVR